MAGYIRQSTFVDGDTITAALFNDEYNQLVNAFSNTTGHKHDGTTAEGPVIGLIGDAGETSPNNKVLIDTTNNYIEFYVEVSSAPVQQLYIADGAIVPVTDNDIDLGTSSLEFKNLYLDGTAKIDTLTVDEAATIGTTLGVTGATTLSSTLAVTGTSTLTGNVTTTNDLSVGGNLTVTGNATISGNLTFGDADTDSINLAAEIDSDIIPNTDGTYDLGSATKEWQDLYIDGTANIDSLVADTADINAGTIDNTVIGGTTAVAGSFTTATATTGNITTVNATTVDTTNIEVTNLKAKDGTSAGSIADTTGVVTLASSVLTTTDINGGTIDGVTIGGTSAGAVTFTDLSDGTITITGFVDEDNMASNSATLVPTQQSVKAYVDAQVTAQDLDFQGDTGGALSIDLDSETLTIAGGTGIDTSGATNTLTVSIDSTVATLTGTQTLTNKTLTSPTVNTATISGGTINNAVIGGTTPAAGTFTTLTANTSITGTLATAAQPNITSVGTLSSLTTSGNVTVGGNLTVNGTTTTVNSTTITVDDPVITLGGDTAPASDDNKDRGVEFRWHNGTAAKVGFFGYDDSASVFTFIPDATNTSEVFSGSAGNVAFGNIAGTLTTAAQPNITSLGTLTGLTTTGDINFGDNDKAIFGAGGDLEIYHSGSDSFIRDVGTGDLYIRSSSALRLQALSGENYAVFTENGAATFYYDNGTKLATTSSGIDVTGTVVADGLTVDTNTLYVDSTNNRVGIGTTSPARPLHSYSSSVGTVLKLDSSGVDTGMEFAHSGTVASAINSSSGGDLEFRTGANSGANERMRIDSSGNVGIGTTSPNNLLTLEDGDLQIHETSTSDPLIQFSIGGTQASPTQSWLLRVDNSDSDKFQLFDQTDSRAVLTADGDGNIGIGTTSPSNILKVFNTANSDGVNVENTNASFTESGLFVNNTASTGGNLLRLRSSGSDKVVVLGTGNVGIGTSSPDARLHIDGGTVSSLLKLDVDSGVSGSILFRKDNTRSTLLPEWTIQHKSNNEDFIIYGYDGTTFKNVIDFDWSATATKFFAGTAEAMRIDSSGNLLVGTTVARVAEFGTDYGANILVQSGNEGQIQSKTNGIFNAIFDRKTSDGGIMQFRKDGSVVGSIASVATGKIGFYGSGGTGAVIDSSGNVGIGTSSPTDYGATANTLEVKGASGSGSGLIKVTGADGVVSGALYASGSSTMVLNTQTNHALSFNTNNTERMRIDSSGNLLVGTTSGSNKLTVNGDQALLANGSLKFADAGNLHVGMIKNSGASNTGQLEFYTGSTPSERMRIDSSGRVLVGITGASGFGQLETTTFATEGQCILARTGGSVGIGTTSPNTGITVATSANISQVAITSSAGSVAWNATAAANAYYATTENTTFAAPTNAVEGAIITVEIAQGATAYTVAWNTVFEFAASTAPTVTATANKTDIFSFRYNGSVWQEIGRTQNLAQT